MGTGIPRSILLNYEAIMERKVNIFYLSWLLTLTQSGSIGSASKLSPGTKESASLMLELKLGRGGGW